MMCVFLFCVLRRGRPAQPVCVPAIDIISSTFLIHILPIHSLFPSSESEWYKETLVLVPVVVT